MGDYTGFHVMKYLEKITLNNYRCFEHLEIDLHPRLTVFVGENGAGKTAVLDAIASGLGRYLTKLPGVNGLTSKEADLRIDSKERKAAFLTMAWQVKKDDGSSLIWSASRRRSAAVKPTDIEKGLSPEDFDLVKFGLKPIHDFAIELVKADEAGDAYFLPVVAYYGTNRAIRDDVQRRTGFRKQFTRFEALAGALESDSRFRAAIEWFNAMEDSERRAKDERKDFAYHLPELQVVRNAVVAMMPDGFSNPRTEIRPFRFVIDRLTPDGVTRTLRINQLSDGFKVVLGLVMDLARRMAQANGRMRGGGNEIMNPLALPAIALIDEIDLHLHPRWQQKILSDLMKTFSATQFIVTTHSPQVLSTVKRENIRVISQKADGTFLARPPLAMTYGEPSGDVMQSVMEVDPQPPVVEKVDLQRLTELVDQGRYDTKEVNRLQRGLNVALGEQHPQLQRLQRSIQRQKALKQ